MGLLRLAGFRAVRITSTWEPGLDRADRARGRGARNVAAAAALHGVRVYVSVYHAGSRTTPLTPGARAEFAAYVAEIVRANPSLPRRDRRQRAEPEPLLAAAVQRGRHRRLGPGLPRAARATTYDAVKAAAPETVVWGGALAPRGVDKPLTGRDTISPTRFIRRVGRGVPRERPQRSRSWTASPSTLRRSTRASAVDLPPARPDHLGADRPGQARAPARPGLRRHRAGRLRAADPLRRVRDRVGRSRPEKAGALHRHRAGDDEAGRRGRAGARPTRRRCKLAYCQSNVAGVLLFHAADEAGRRGWQSGLYYADGTPKSSLGVVRDTHGRDRERRARQVRCPDQARRRVRTARPVRSRSDATATASTAHGWCGFRRIGHGLEERPRGPRHAAVVPGSAPASPGQYRLSVTFVHATRPGPAVVRASAPFSVRSPPRGADARRLRRRRRRTQADRARPGAEAARVPRRGRRRRRPRAPARRSASSARPASARSGSRASGSPASRRRPPEELAVLRDVAERAGGTAHLPRRLPHAARDDAADRPRRGRSSPRMSRRSCARCRRSAT